MLIYSINDALHHAHCELTIICYLAWTKFKRSTSWHTHTLDHKFWVNLFSLWIKLIETSTCITYERRERTNDASISSIHKRISVDFVQYILIKLINLWISNRKFFLSIYDLLIWVSTFNDGFFVNLLLCYWSKLFE